MHARTGRAGQKDTHTILLLLAVLLLPCGAASVVVAWRKAGKCQRHAWHAGEGPQRAGVPRRSAGVPVHGAWQGGCLPHQAHRLRTDSAAAWYTSLQSYSWVHSLVLSPRHPSLSLHHAKEAVPVRGAWREAVNLKNQISFVQIALQRDVHV